MTIEEIGKFNMKLLELRVINDMNNKLNKRRLELLDDERVKEYLGIIEMQEFIRKNYSIHLNSSYNDMISEIRYKFGFTVEGEFWIKKDIYFLNLNDTKILSIEDDEERKEFERTHNIILAPGDYNVCEYYDILAAEYIKTAIEEGNASAQKLIYKLIS